MSEKAEEARRLFMEGYNCTQAVVGAFAGELGIDFETAMRFSSSFGGGMGRLREVCGAVSGMFMVAGLKFGYSSPDAFLEKSEHYKRIQELAEKFSDKNGSIVCRDILKLRTHKDTPNPEPRTKEYYKNRPCAEIVAGAAAIIDEYIKNN
ncbi:MAG: C_GCAxxG_C_C family protein [Clostridia bacterium]|nr:C_GCAxxG_C_C family protein [Clostridia bacterium]